MEEPTLMEEKFLKQTSEKLKYILKNYRDILKRRQCTLTESSKVLRENLSGFF